jgi:hypothetical protein
MTRRGLSLPPIVHGLEESYLNLSLAMRWLTAFL